MTKEEEKKADADLEEFKKEKLAEKHNPEEKAEAEEKEEENPQEPLQIDHEAELKKEREARKVAEDKLEETRDKARKRIQDKKEVEDTEDDPQEKPLTASELKDILATDRQESRKELQVTQIADIARKIAGDKATDAEVQRIIETHKERTFPSYLSLDQQLAESHAIVNSPRIIAQNSELKRSLLSKDTKGTSDETATKDVAKAGEPKLEASFRQELQKQNFLWDGKQFKKKLEGGKTLIKDWKTMKVHVE